MGIQKVKKKKRGISYRSQTSLSQSQVWNGNVKENCFQTALVKHEMEIRTNFS